LYICRYFACFPFVIAQKIVHVCVNCMLGEQYMCFIPDDACQIVYSVQMIDLFKLFYFVE